MPIDPNIILQGQGPQLANPMDMMAKALTLKQLANQGRLQDQELADNQAMKDAYRKNLVTGPDGKASLNQVGLLSDLAKINPMKSMEVEGQFRKQKLETDDQQLKMLTNQTARAKQLSWSIVDEPSYQQARMTAIKEGLPNADKMPMQYDPNIVKRMQMATLTAEEQLAQAWKQKEFGLKEQDSKIKKEELGIKKSQLNYEMSSGEKLPIDKKKIIEGLSTKNANKISIKNQIDAVMDNWDKLSDDQKVASGRQLLKTLNSTEGADAIGAEEASRLGANLEFALGNFTNSNPTQFGRDLKGFKEQAQNISKSIGTAVESNKAVIDKELGRKQTKPGWAL